MHDLEQLTGVPVYKRTNINNENNNNNENNKKQLKSLSPEQTDNIYPFRDSLASLRSETSSPSVSATEPHAVGGIGSAEDPLPNEWRYLKIDLFDNGDEHKQNLRVAVNILREVDQQWVYARASVNGPWRNVKRSMDLSNSQDRLHYAKLKAVRDEIAVAGLTPMCSKMYLKGNNRKGKTIPGLSVAVAALPNDGDYLVVIVRQDKTIIRQLSNQAITAKQRQSNLIASSATKQEPKISLESLGI